MATIVQTPESFTPAYNENVFVASGTTAGKNDYQFIFNIYDETGTTKLVPSIKIPPRPTDSYAVFDAGRIIEAYLASDIAILGNGQEGFKSNTNSYYPYKVKIGEEFDASTTGVTSYPDQVTSSGTVYAFNSCYPFQEFADYNYQTRVCSVGDGAEQLTRFLCTNQNTISGTVDGSYTYTDLKAVRIGRDENAWLYIMRSNVNAFGYMIIACYNSSGSEIKSFRVENFNMSGTARHLRVPTGTRNMANIDSGLIASFIGSLPVISSTVAYYDVFMFDSTLSSRHSEAVRYIIQDTQASTIKLPYADCSKYDTYRLHFLNKFGGYDSYTFNRVSRVTEEIERKSYKKVYGSTTGRWSYNTYDRGKVNYNTSINDKLTLNSDWLTESEYAWLEELVASPEVFWDNGNELQAVNITNNNYEKKKAVNDKVFNLTVEVEITQKRYRQRG